MNEPHLLSLTVNGTEQEVVVEPRRTLADVLRHDLRLTGTHVGCEHGVCGCCTVLLDGRPVRSCLLLAVTASGSEVTTVEGLAAGDGTLSAVQTLSDGEFTGELPQVAVAPGGSALVAWQGFDGANVRIQAAAGP